LNSLITANLTHHPARTLASLCGVALGVILVVLTVGLVRGQLRERGARDGNLTVELMLSLAHQGSFSFTTMPVSMPVSRIAEIRGIPGVSAATAVAQHLEFGGNGALGLRQVDGVNFDEYQKTTGVHIVEGQPLPASGEVMVVDTKYAAATKKKPGDKIKLLDRDFTIIGVYAPETGARMIIPLQTMQTLLNAPSLCSMVLVKCADPLQQEAVAQRLADQFPDLRILFTRDLPALFATGFVAFNVFLKAVAGLAALISLLIVLLTSYTTVTERTRQIGILKALGASRGFIALVFLKESLLINCGGVIGGLLLALLVRFILAHWNGVKVSLESDYIAFAVAGGLLSSVVGTLYPAWRAAGQDPVDALSYE
jgi:putative ABC transport system permease protein